MNKTPDNESPNSPGYYHLCFFLNIFLIGIGNGEACECDSDDTYLSVFLEIVPQMGGRRRTGSGRSLLPAHVSGRERNGRRSLLPAHTAWIAEHRAAVDRPGDGLPSDTRHRFEC